MAKRVTANWYTKTHTVHHNPPIVINCGEYEDYPVYLHTTIEESLDGTLFSHSIHRTKIKEEDLPGWYCPAYLYRHHGWINVKNITDIQYRPNNWINHLFKDDLLFMKFGGEIKNAGSPDYDYDLLVWGWDLVTLTVYLDAYQVLHRDKIEEIKQQIRNKVKSYKKNHPEEHDAIELEKYEERYKKELDEVFKKIQDNKDNKEEQK